MGRRRAEFGQRSSRGCHREGRRRGSFEGGLEGGPGRRRRRGDLRPRARDLPAGRREESRERRSGVWQALRPGSPLGGPLPRGEDGGGRRREGRVPVPGAAGERRALPDPALRRRRQVLPSRRHLRRRPRRGLRQGRKDARPRRADGRRAGPGEARGHRQQNGLRPPGAHAKEEEGLRLLLRRPEERATHEDPGPQRREPGRRTLAPAGRGPRGVLPARRDHPPRRPPQGRLRTIHQSRRRPFRRWEGDGKKKNLSSPSSGASPPTRSSADGSRNSATRKDGASSSPRPASAQTTAS
mmetsp:Transcript_35325/g.112936  ORF Transcript_35325/g.112936 Transcript_35325/m.112936 type:complete len:297 (+) Transcript_35325:371-1261(+)